MSAAFIRYAGVLVLSRDLEVVFPAAVLIFYAVSSAMFANRGGGCVYNFKNKMYEHRSIHPSVIRPSLLTASLGFQQSHIFILFQKPPSQFGRLPQTLLIGRHWATNTCRFIINTCCVITDTCFRLHWLFHGDRIRCNEWLNVFFFLNFHQSGVSTAATRLLISMRTINRELLRRRHMRKITILNVNRMFSFHWLFPLEKK